MIGAGQDGEPVLKRNNLSCVTCLSCLYLVVSTKVNNQEQICKGKSTASPANFQHHMSHADGRPVMPPCRMSIRRLYGSFRRVVWGDGGVCSLMTKSPAFDARTEMVAPKAFGRFTPRFTPPAQNDVKTGTGAFARTTCQKRKRLDNRQIVKPFLSVGVTGFEPATTRPPDVYSNRTELRPDSATEAVSPGLGLQI